MLHHFRRFSGAEVVRVPTKSAAPPLFLGRLGGFVICPVCVHFLKCWFRLLALAGSVFFQCFNLVFEEIEVGLDHIDFG